MCGQSSAGGGRADWPFALLLVAVDLDLERARIACRDPSPYLRTMWPVKVISSTDPVLAAALGVPIDELLSPA